MISRSRSSGWACGAALAAAALCSSTARAEVRHEGDWDDDAEVTIDLEQVPRADAVKRLANAAGWSVVFDAPASFDLVTVHVKEQSAGKVLDLLLSNGRYVASRDDSLIHIRRAEADEPGVTVVIPPIPPIPAVPPVPPVPPLGPMGRRWHNHDHDDDADDHEERGNDRVVTGGSLRIEKGDVAHDVTVMGGNVDVFGTATGDVAAMGGSVRIHKGAHVRGDATALGGALTVEDGARIDGDVAVLGGVLRRGKDAEIHGDVKVNHGRHARRLGRDVVAAAADGDEAPVPLARRIARDAGSALTRMALLFVFGSILSSLATSRMEALKQQIASRPMRTFATGVLASIAAVVLFIALCVTVIGIPFAIVGALLAFFAAFAGLSAVLETAGAALVAHKTRNPYVHLALGCALFMLASAIPFVGPVVTVVLFFTGIGSVAATRAAGLFPSRNRPAGTPYRDAPIAV